MFNVRCFKFEIIFLFFIFLPISVMAESPRMRVQLDTVEVPQVESVPTIDGHSNDACWAGTSWQTIDQVWIPYGATVEADDYTGQYKVAWSDTENVLYFVVEITDDVFVDGYVFPNGGYYNYDIVEVFIDEDKSGGMHRIDQGEENAENAFAYHIVVDAPADGDTTSEFVVCDNAGFYDIVNYASHFPEFVMRKDENQYTWEFSLAVYADTLDTLNPETSRVDLSEGKIIGLSLAFCDNDSVNEVPKERDNFFGSVWVPAEEYNDHWMNADGFGTIKLIGESSGIEDTFAVPEISFMNYPNPFKDKTVVEFNLPKSSKVTIDVLNVLGQPVDTIIDARFSRGKHMVEWTPLGIPSGIYFYRLQTNSFKRTKKLLIIK